MAYTPIDKSDEYFNIVLYTGNGGTQSITGVGFQPDMVWAKARANTYNNTIIDSVRGVNKRIVTNLTDQEYSDGAISSFDSDGFSFDRAGAINLSSSNVAWSWLGGGTASSNTDGSISSTVSANTTSGFSIVSYTGTGVNGTIGHGIGQAPDMIIVKRRDSADGWKVYNSPRGATKYLQLNTTDAEGTLSSQWNNTEPTSSVFSVGTAGDINGGGGRTYIAYCFASIKGFSKVGSYTGNGSTDGPFIYTGFKPAFLFFKKVSAAENWYITDNKRAPFNDSRNFPDHMPVLYPNLNNAEGFLNDEIDLLSNGFKIRGGNSAHNTSGATYLYMAFAENPFTTSTGIPTTAR